MGLSYTEELVSEYYRHKTINDTEVPQYFISERVQFKKGKSSGFSDIDVLAIGTDEICIIQTKAFAVFKSTVKESIEATIEYFTLAEEFVKQRYSINGKKITKIFVADYGLSENFKSQLLKEDIEPIRMKDIFIKYLKLKNEVKELRNEVSEKELENKNREAEIDSLEKKNPAKIERTAREKYGMMKKGEKIIKVEEK